MPSFKWGKWRKGLRAYQASAEASDLRLRAFPNVRINIVSSSSSFMRLAGYCSSFAFGAHSGGAWRTPMARSNSNGAS